MTDLPVLVALAVAVFACLYAEWSMDRPVPKDRRHRLGRWTIERVVEVR